METSDRLEVWFIIIIEIFF